MKSFLVSLFILGVIPAKAASDCSLRIPTNASKAVVNILKKKFNLVRDSKAKYSLSSKVNENQAPSYTPHVDNVTEADWTTVNLYLWENDRVIYEIEAEAGSGIFNRDDVEIAHRRAVKKLPSCLNGEI